MCFNEVAFFRTTWDPQNLKVNRAEMPTGAGEKFLTPSGTLGRDFSVPNWSRKEKIAGHTGWTMVIFPGETFGNV